MSSFDGTQDEAYAMVKLKPSIRPTETYTEPNFLRLHTVARPSEQSWLVTLEHLCYQPQPAAAERRGTSSGASAGWRCQTIVDGEAMSKEDALFIARTYAVENNIPVIYECHSE